LLVTAIHVFETALSVVRTCVDTRHEAHKAGHDGSTAGMTGKPETHTLISATRY